jgi:hypothetical protein
VFKEPVLPEDLSWRVVHGSIDTEIKVELCAGDIRIRQYYVKLYNTLGYRFLRYRITRAKRILWRREQRVRRGQAKLKGLLTEEE